ncbi:hypothetical protein ACLOJK_012259 [Asimina triloba]
MAYLLWLNGFLPSALCLLCPWLNDLIVGAALSSVPRRWRLAHHVLLYGLMLIAAGRGDGGDRRGMTSSAAVGACSLFGDFEVVIDGNAVAMVGGAARDCTRLLRAARVLELSDSLWKMKNAGRRGRTAATGSASPAAVLVRSRQIQDQLFVVNFLVGANHSS